jgi:signal transduction histidine kinase
VLPAPQGSGTRSITQAFSNRVSNAIQHSPAGPPITVRVSSGDSPVAVEVHNEGHIAEEVRPYLFSPFAAGEKSRGSGGGLGLGLFC